MGAGGSEWDMCIRVCTESRKVLVTPQNAVIFCS